MKNVEILKKVVPLLRENEEVVYIPEKCKGNFAFHLFFLIFLLIVIEMFFYQNLENSSKDTIMLLLVCLLMFLSMIIVCVVTFKSNFIVITNQRVICSRYFKITIFERDNIQKIHYSYQNDKHCISNVLIEIKDSAPYIIEYFDYKKIKEQLGL
ncbi:MAG: hypothetical protein IJY61_02445 [Candidatus Gastranaerophilales bacterium]|nr:hypothetical protein [Candidatus Gastranaerophilales bacterium]